MTSSPGSFYTKFRYLGVPVSGIVIYVSFFLINPPEAIPEHYNQSTIASFLIEVLYATVFAFIVSEISIQIAKRLDRQIPWETAPQKRFFWQLTAQMIITVVVLQILFLIPLDPEYDSLSVAGPDEELVNRQATILGLFLSFIVTAIFTGEYFLNRWRRSILEGQELKRIALNAQLDALRTQLAPHFLFNNFSTLSSLIMEDQRVAVDFLGKLSNVYRYLLQTREKDVISIREELNFISSYLYLIKTRFGDNLVINVDVSEAYYAKGIPPITLQLMIENAIKHNVVSRGAPLQISITGQHDELVIRNNLQRIAIPEPSSGMGLKNIRERYKLLGDLEPQVIETDRDFIVRLPLLEIR